MRIKCSSCDTSYIISKDKIQPNMIFRCKECNRIIQLGAELDSIKEKEVIKKEVWFLALNNKPAGPFSEEKVKKFLKERRIDKSSLVWREGFPSWKKISDTPEFRSFSLSLIPPPLPQNMQTKIPLAESPKNKRASFPLLLFTVFITTFLLTLAFGIVLGIFEIRLRKVESAKEVPFTKKNITSQIIKKIKQEGLDFVFPPQILDKSPIDSSQNPEPQSDSKKSKRSVPKKIKSIAQRIQQDSKINETLPKPYLKRRIWQKEEEQNSGLGKSEIRKVIIQNKSSIQRCYERATRGIVTPTTQRIEVEIKIGASGKVTQVDLLPPEVKDSYLGKCIARSIKRWRFPKSNASSNIKTSFLFTPSE
jgi:predicted Zn finger-like uncharacterized protein